MRHTLFHTLNVFSVDACNSFTLDLRNRVLSIRDDSSGVPPKSVKTPLPKPKFFEEKSFSSKKEKSAQRADKSAPPPTPRGKLEFKSASISRFSYKGSDFSHDRARSISFRDSNSSLSSAYNSASDKLYFEQCFEIISKLGSGSFGDVFKVKCKEDKKYYAVKCSKQKFAGKADRERKLQEVQKYEQLPSHPNCVKFYKAWEEKQHLYIQTELCSKSLSQYADTNHQIPESIVWNYLVDLLLAVKHLHDHDLVHLDIKPDNIFISESGVCKLGDFGLILDLTKADTTDAIEGDPRYIAPELMQSVFSKAADIFSLGITILELASDLDLPRGDELWHLLRNLKIPEQFLKGLSAELIGVISLMMEPNYVKRPSIDDVLSLPVVDKIVSERKKILRESLKSSPSPFNRVEPVSSDSSSNLSDDVFDKNTSINEHEFSFSLNNSLNNSFNATRSESRLLAMSTPCGYRYLNPKLQARSGSPSLTGSRKKNISPHSDRSPTTKSPRLQLFNSSSEDDDLSSNIPAKNLLAVFDTLSPSP